MPVRQLQLDIDTMFVTTWYNILPGIIDNIFSSNPFWYYLNKNDKRKEQTGGRWIEVNLEYADSADVVAWIGRTHDLATQVNAAKLVDPLTSAKFDWRYVTASLYRYWQDDQQNRGKAKLFDLVSTKLNNAKKTLSSQFETKLFTLNNGAADNCIDGLPNIIRDDPNPAGSTYLCGGITQGQDNNAWWNNKSKNFGDQDPTVSLVPDMRTMFNDLSDGEEHPDLFVTTQDIFELYEDETLEYKQIVNQSLGDASFETIQFKGRPLVYSRSCGAGRMYFLNFDYIYWVYDPEINFDMTDWKEAQNNLDRTAQIICAGNLVSSNRSKQGVIYGIN